MKSASITPGRLRELSQVFPCGLAGRKAAEIFRARREAHLERLSVPAVFAGLDREPGAEHVWSIGGARIFQEPALMHLCGINQSGVRLLLDPGAKDPAGRAVLFLPERNPSREFWDGVRLGLLPVSDPGHEAALAELQALTGFDTVLPLSEFRPTLETLVALRRLERVGVFFHAWPAPDGGRPREVRTDRNWDFSREVARWLKPWGCGIESIAPLHFELRLPLDPWRVREAERAQAWTEEAFRAVLPRISALGSETRLAAALEGEMLSRSPFGLAFPTICAGGRNACTLHYMKNDEPLPEDGLVLLDFGCRSSAMHSDISRTLPVSGRFDPLQRLLYGIVLEAMEFNESNVRPGATIRELNAKVWQRLEDLLEERFLAKGGVCERAYVDGAVKSLPSKAKAHPRQPHGVSHLMGEQEHDGDPFRLYQDVPLRPGMMLSNEPGLYGRFRIRLEGRQWDRWIGIRIEDDLLVTATGGRNLTREQLPD
jgi:Xaa-Pro aminopeptidase